MTLIDLGELTEPTEPAPPRRRGPARNRRLWAALVALAALLTVAGAAPPAARVHATVPAGLGADVLLSADQIFIVTPAPGVTDGTRELVAYPRPGHATVRPQRLAPLWRVSLPAGSSVFQAEPVDDFGVLFSISHQSSTLDVLETWLLDSRTGQQRWRAPGAATLDGAGRVLLRTFIVGEPTILKAVDLADGREVWSTSLLAVWMDHHQRDGVIDAIVVATSAGDVEVLEPETGKPRHRLPPFNDDPGGYLQASVVGDLVVVVRNSRTVTAYDLDGLTQRWQTAVPLADYVTPCGVLICAQVASGGAHFLDSATGALRWTSPDTVNVVVADGVRALAVASTGGDALDVIAVDAATGATLTEYGTWSPVFEYEYTQRLLGTRVVPDIGLLLARLDPAEPRPRHIDVLAGAVRECQHRGDLVACRRQDGDIGVWRLPD
ncbi:PQQ-binding-like beta-propeller repeat protein [Micromonospora sp. NPDC051296]|uniref:outer membrane protein assembly factor BamB family protein n=1 Tax=Micromonospora sp. NPDC051296 TaxID=3155046 RepID=UPI003446D2D9